MALLEYNITIYKNINKKTIYIYIYIYINEKNMTTSLIKLSAKLQRPESTVAVCGSYKRDYLQNMSSR